MIAGYLFTSVLPKRMADRAFDWLNRNRQAKYRAQLDRDPIAERMNALLGSYLPESDFQDQVTRHHEWEVEDLWARWQASHNSDWQTCTEVVGLEHVDKALNQGKGVVFWGMSFCGTLFAKIALARAGVSLTQLSTADHGAWFPLTMLGKWLAGPLHCLPEDRYLSERIRIPVDGSSRYLYRIGQILKGNGCVWIAGERSRVKKLVSGDMLGQKGRFPVGAPMLALRHHAALLPVHTERLGRLNYRVTIESPVIINEETGRSAAIDQAVQDYAQRLGDQILASPGDWDWNHLWVRNMLSSRSGDADSG